MKKVLIIMAVFVAMTFVFGACGSDSKPHCEKIVIPCDPGCTAPQICCSDTCKAMTTTCTPACKTDGTEYCDPCGTGCLAVPKTCTPACNATTQWCDNGTCKDIPPVPVCDPVCAAGEYCTE
jgi:hypothetical protein